MGAPTDIIMLTHNRLDHLVATVDALEARTRAPYRLTIVDNASGPEVRNWLAHNRHRFHQILWRTENEFLGALNHGIAATTSDPYMVTDPDLVVPELDPCWLTRMRDTLDRHPDFGLLGIGLDQSNLPPVQEPESIAPEEIVDGEIVERPVGSVFTLIRRDALRSPYRTDWYTCQSVQRAGYRYGWMLGVRAFHLGWDDFKLHPGHLASKLVHGPYREVQLIDRAPTLPELALAGPVLAVTRAAEVPDASVLEIAYGGPAVAAAVPAARALAEPLRDGHALGLAEGGAGAVVVVDPPAAEAADTLAEALRVAARLVVTVAPLEAFGGRSAAELAPPGWTAHERPGPGDVPVALAAAASADPALEPLLAAGTLDDRERWLALFAAAAFGPARRRLFVFERDSPLPVPDALAIEPSTLALWEPVAVTPTAPRRGLGERVRGRVAREWAVASEVARLRAARLRLGR